MGGSILQATGKSADLIAHSYGDYKAKITALSELAKFSDYYPTKTNAWKFPF
jgi:hypothetical protein